MAHPSRPPSFRSFDAFARPMDGLRSQTVAGGVITILALSFAGLLFLSQLFVYLQHDSRQSIRLAPSYPLSVILPSGGAHSIHVVHELDRRSRPDHRANLDVNRKSLLQRNLLDIHVHITFPYIPCADLHFIHDGAATSGTNTFAKIHGPQAVVFRTPTAQEYLLARAGPDKDDSVSHGPDSSIGIDPGMGCTIQGHFQTMRIGGEISLSLTPQAWDKAVRNIRTQVALNPQLTWTNIGALINMTHYIHQVDFGLHFPLALHHPLKDRWEVVNNPSGIAVIFHNVKIIPTQFQSFIFPQRLFQQHTQALNMVQLSTATHVIQPETLEASNAQTLPGILLHYDLSPLEVYQEESREHILVFITSLISIVGGVFVTVGWMSQFLVDSAKVIAKKRD
jgi:hypothetical protein